MIVSERGDYNCITFSMRSSKAKPTRAWLREAKNRVQIDSLDLQDFVELKREAKKISILTRIENRTKTNSSSFSQPRPKTTVANQPKNRAFAKFKDVEDMFVKQKSLTRAALEEERGSTYKEGSGLLGEWSRYESMQKRQLIQKLISLEHLANAIFKRNKFLQDELKKVEKA